MNEFDRWWSTLTPEMQQILARFLYEHASQETKIAVELGGSLINLVQIIRSQR